MTHNSEYLQIAIKVILLGQSYIIFFRKFSSRRPPSPMSDQEKTLEKILERVAARFNEVGYKSLSEVEKVFHCVWVFEAELNNGEFDQFSSNSSGDLAHESVEALKFIGAKYTSGLLEKGIAVFPKGKVPKDALKRQGIEIDSKGQDRLEKLEEKFYEYRDDLGALLYQYAQIHLGELNSH